MGIIRRIYGACRTRPASPDPSLCGIAVITGWFGERLSLEQQFIAVWRAADHCQSLVPPHRQLRNLFSDAIKNKDSMRHIFGVRDKDRVTHQDPVLDYHVAFGNNINELGLSGFLKLDFDDTTIGCFVICYGENLVVQQLQPKHVSDPAEDGLCRAFKCKALKIDVGDNLLLEAINEEGETRLVSCEG